VILVDTSAWIEYDRATGSPIHHRVRAGIERSEPLATTGIVLLELLAGARDDEHSRELERLLARWSFIPLDESCDYHMAAAIYRSCRLAGETLRRVQDCLIAAVAMRVRAELLHRDADFDAIARHAPLAIARS
jgi:hypothetical protein